MVSRYSTIRFLPNKSTLTLFIFKFVPWLPYMNIIISICYFFYTLFIICFYLDGDLSNILIDFNSNYSAAFDLYTDNTVYSSGGNNGNFFLILLGIRLLSLKTLKTPQQMILYLRLVVLILLN